MLRFARAALTLLVVTGFAQVRAQDLVLAVNTGVTYRVTPQEIREKYKGLADLIGKELKRTVRVQPVDDYSRLRKGLDDEEFDLAFRHEASPVSSSVDALSRSRMKRGAGLGLLVVAPVSLQQPHPGATQFTRRSHGAIIEVIIENVVTGVGNRMSIGDAVPIRRNILDRVPDVPHRSLGGATDADDLHIPEVGADTAGRAEGDPITTQEGQPKTIL